MDEKLSEFREWLGLTLVGSYFWSSTSASDALGVVIDEFDERFGA